MIAVIRVGECEFPLEWSLEGETCRFRVESQEERTASVVKVEPGVYSLLLDGRSYSAHVEPRGDGWMVTVGGRRLAVEVIDPRRWSRREHARHGDGRQDVTAVMPGKVVRVLVSEGDAVVAGQGVVVVEAMKMQNEIKSARPGRVIAVAASVGAAVNPGDVLVTIE